MKIAIIGAGIAGTAAALFLRAAGHEPTVFEAYPARAKVGGRLSIAPNGLLALREIGPADAVVAAGTRADRYRFRSGSGKSLGAMATGIEGAPYPFAVTLSRQTICDLLLDRAVATGIPIVFGKRLCTISQAEDSATAHFHDGSERRADAVLGADGIHSAVRSAILTNSPKPSFTGLVGGGGFVPRSVMKRIAGDAGEMDLFFGNGAFVGATLGDQKEENGAFWWYAVARNAPIAGIARLVSDSGIEAPTARELIAATTLLVPPVNLFDVAGLPAWSSHRAVLIGDAAHAVSPHSGRGVSMALEDAFVLTRLLKDLHNDAAGAFRQLQTDRQARVARVIALGRKSGDLKRAGPFAAAMQRQPPRWLFCEAPTQFQNR